VPSRHSVDTNLRCAGILGVCMPNPSNVAFILSEITEFIRTDEQTDMARSTWLVILIRNIYFMGSETLPFTCYIPFHESSITFYSTSNGYKHIVKLLTQCNTKKFNLNLDFTYAKYSSKLAETHLCLSSLVRVYLL